MYAEQPLPGRLETLSEISRAVSSTLDLRDLYDVIYQQVGRVMDTSQFFIALHQPGASTIQVPYLQEEGTLLLDQEFPYGDNTTSVIINAGDPLLYGTAEEYAGFERRHGLTSYVVGEKDSESGIFVPLNTGSRTIGAMSVQTLRQHAYTWDDAQLLAVIASQAAVAIENARLYKRSQDSVRQMQALLAVAQTINQSLELGAVFDAILLSIRDVIPNAYAALLLPDYEAGTLDIVDSLGPKGLPADDLERLKLPFGHGISGRVFEAGEPLIVPDVRDFPGFVDHGLPSVLSEMAVPLRRGESVVGVLDVGREGVGAFAEEEIGLLSLFASQAAIALENARLFSEQRRRVEELQTIQSIVRDLTPLHDQEEIGATVNRELKRLIDYHSCRLHVMDPDSSTLTPMTSSDTSAPLLKLAIDRGFAGWIARTGKADVIPSTLNDPRPAHIPGTPRRDESMIGAPLVYEGRVRGVITLSRLGVNQFDENDLRLLEIIGAQVAIAFDRARLYEELRREAITDPLVRLWNRRYLMERFREERLRAARSGRTLVALMLDIDKFKRVNDTYGHDAGDVVLQELARLVRAQMRAEDIVARYGGEEFCVLLPETPVSEALQVAERLRVVTAEYRMPAAAGVDHVTFSVGAACWVPTDVAEEVFSRADLAMYAVKRRGGNGVCIAEGNTFRCLEPGTETEGPGSSAPGSLLDVLDS